MKITIKNSWDSVTWKEYEQIEQVFNADIPVDYKTIHLVSILTGLSIDEIENIPITEFNKLLKAIEFLQKEPKTHTHKFEYTVNGREYIFRGKLDEITTAQYIDYRTYMAEKEKDVVKLFSCFLIPKGHDYNDGYDIEQVKSDIEDMCWLDVRAAAFFFKIQLSAFILILKSYLVDQMKEMKATKKQRKELEAHLNSSVYSLLYSKSAKSVLPPSKMLWAGPYAKLFM